MFKVAGELALQSYLIGEMGLALTDEEIRRYRNAAYDRVRKQHGILRLEEALSDDD